MSVWAGRFCWYELMTPDPAAALKFYQPLFGWQVPSSRVEGYTMIATGPKPEDGIGGVMKFEQPGVPPHWTGYIEVDDIAQGAQAVRDAGGQVVHGPQAIPGVGQFAVCLDPQGAAYTIYQSGTRFEGAPPKGQVPVGKIGWHELFTSDVAAGFEYYSKLYGWELITKMPMGPGQEYWIFGYGGEQMGGIGPNMGGSPPAWLYTIRVPNADEFFEKAKAHGATPMYGPMDIPGGGRAGAMMDPQGAAFGYFHASPAEVAAENARQ